MSSYSDFMLCKLVWTDTSKNVGIKHSLLTHREFSTSQSVFEAKAIPLRAAGRDKRPDKSCSLYKEVKKLWKWLSFPSSHYTHTMVAFHIAFWVAWQTGAPHDATMQAEDFSTQKDNNGTKYITFAKGITKIRQSRLHEKHRLTLLKMFTTMERCPIRIFKFYLSKRRLELRNNGPLYLSVITDPSSEVWHKIVSMGINKINNLMKKMIRSSPLSVTNKKITNHSARKN